MTRGIVLVEPREVNGQPGAILQDRHGQVLAVLALDVLDGYRRFRAVVNPDKLEHLRSVADASRLCEELQARRRPTP